MVVIDVGGVAPIAINPLLVSESNLKVEPAFISSASIVNPPITPPLNKTAEPVICPVAPFSRKVPALEFKSSPIVNPPISPSAAVIVPVIVTSPLDDRWKLEELISMLPSEPLINCAVLPKKNFGVAKVTELPLRVVSPVLNIFILPVEPLIKLVSFPK